MLISPDIIRDFYFQMSHMKANKILRKNKLFVFLFIMLLLEIFIVEYRFFLSRKENTWKKCKFLQNLNFEGLLLILLAIARTNDSHFWIQHLLL